MAYSERDFLDGLAAGLTATAGSEYIRPPRRLILIYDMYTVAEDAPVLQSLDYQGAEPLKFGFQIEYDAGTNGGAIEEVNYGTGGVWNLGWAGLERKGVSPWIRGDITGARVIPVYFYFDNGKAKIVARRGAFELAENNGEWSLNGERGYVWYDPVQMMGRYTDYYSSPYFSMDIY